MPPTNSIVILKSGNKMGEGQDREVNESFFFEQTFVLHKYLAKNKRLCNPICVFVNNIKEINFYY